MSGNAKITLVSLLGLTGLVILIIGAMTSVCRPLIGVIVALVCWISSGLLIRHWGLKIKLAVHILPRFFFILVTILLTLVVLEMGSAIMLKSLASEEVSMPEAGKVRNWRYYYESSGLFEDIDIDTYYGEQEAIWSNLSFDFYRFYRPKANFQGKYFSTDEQGFRKTVQHLKSSKLEEVVIVFFGGSTMWGAGAAGNHATIPSLFSKYMNEMDSERNYVVKNCGVGGYHNTPEMIILLEKIGTENVDFVIFFDWVNEAIMGYRELLDGNNESPFLQPSVGIGLRGFRDFLSDWGLRVVSEADIKPRNFIDIIEERSNIAKIILWLVNDNGNMGKEDRDKEEEEKPSKNLAELTDQELKQAERIVRLYRKNKEIIESLSSTFGFTPYFIMQPNLYTKEKLSPYEKDSPYWEYAKTGDFHRKVYELARQEFAGDSNFFDLSGCMDTAETIWFDDHHTSIKGNELVVKAILDRIGAEIIRISRE